MKKKLYVCNIRPSYLKHTIKYRPLTELIKNGRKRYTRNIKREHNMQKQ